MPKGYIRGLSQYYKTDNLERMEIWINKRYAAPLPFLEGIRIPIKLKVGNFSYHAGLRTTINMDIVWICPDLRDNNDGKVSLARVLSDNGFRKNQKVFLEVNDKAVHLKATNLADS